ncbi:hypothetical protein DUNSADRAFT_1555 [Dunaliella salina]|uniref:Uncharacterized protein n=1 Tax=Dunaliella salina TaxID=3046 RepID=A0ABQ7FXA2_DUNSA|nr:hypothetical protein DUNSADRAFT_1555 [Dunaliella salina]|eukprot:KAF5826986.1 hypothetical protein DUNSADRAFT_1555 [Dunaliella salina]
MLHKEMAGSSNLIYDLHTQPARNSRGQQLDTGTPEGPLLRPELHAHASGLVQDRAVQASQLKIIGLGMRGVSSADKLAASGRLREADFWAIDSDKKSLASCEGRMQTMEVIACDDACMRAEDLARIAQAPTSVPPEKKDGGAGMAFVAAMTVQELAGPACRDIVVCPQLEEEAESDGNGGDAGRQGDGAAGQGGAITMECSLLVLKAIEDSAGLDLESKEPSLRPQRPLSSSRPATTTAAARLHMSTSTSQSRKMVSATPAVASATGGRQTSPSPASQEQAATAAAAAAAAAAGGITPQHNQGPLQTPPRTTPPSSIPQQQQPLPPLGEDASSTASSSPSSSLSRLPSSSSSSSSDAAALQTQGATTSGLQAQGTNTSALQTQGTQNTSIGVTTSTLRTQSNSVGTSTSASRTQSTSVGLGSTGQATAATPGPVPPTASRQPPQHGSNKWSAMSMLAGGTTKATLGITDNSLGARHTQNQQRQQRPAGGSLSKQQLQLQQQQHLQQQVERRRQQIRQGLQPSPLEPMPPQPHQQQQQQQQQSATSAHSQRVMQQQKQQQQQQQQQKDACMGDQGAQASEGATQRLVQPTQIPRMADNLMTSLVAQSLDLPPSAARWRHHQRAMDSSLPGSLQEQQQQQRRIYDLPVSSSVLVDDEELDEWSDESGEEDERGVGDGLRSPPNPLAAMLMSMAGKRHGGGRGAGQGPAEVDLKSRVAGMLDKERA